MSSIKVVLEGPKQQPGGAPGDGEARMLQVLPKCPSIAAAVSTAAQVLPGHPPNLNPPLPVMMVTKALIPAGGSTSGQPLTNQLPRRVAPANQVKTPAKTLVISVPRAGAPQAVTPQAAPKQLPATIHIPPGLMLSRNESGQLMLVSQQAVAQAQRGVRVVSSPAPRAPSPLVSAAPGSKSTEKVTLIRMAAPSTYQAAPAKKTAVAVSTMSNQQAQPNFQPASRANEKEHLEPPIPFSQVTLENVKKCKSFLITLIKLASSDSRSAAVATIIKGLVCRLLEGKLEVEEFTEKLYKELKSTPQPCLVPFLKKSLPAVRRLTPDPQTFIQQASVSSSTPHTASSKIRPSNTEAGLTLKYSQQVGRGTERPALAQSSISTKRSGPVQKQYVLQTGRHHPGGFLVRQPFSQHSPHYSVSAFKESSGSYKEDDDINDVASMAGVNLSEENAQSLTTLVGTVVQSCQDQPFLAPQLMLSRTLQIGSSLGLTDVGPEVVALVSHATQERLRGLLEKITVVAAHRKAALTEDDWHLKVSDVRSQLRFLEEVESLKKKKKDEEEREKLLRLAKSRSHTEDPQQQQLKQLAKELQQIEQAQLQQREANLTALAAIGPRKKRPLDQSESQVSVLSRPSVSTVRRVVLRDLLLCMEQDASLRHSLLLYKAML